MNYKIFKVVNQDIFYNAFDNTFYKVNKNFINALEDFTNLKYSKIEKDLLNYLHNNIYPIKCDYSIGNLKEENEIFIIFNITANCNLSCKYCEIKKSNETLSMDNIKLLFNNIMNNELLNKLNNIGIGFYGGEPLLEFGKIKSIVKMSEIFFKKKRINFKITSNGTLLTKEILDFFIDNNFFISISFDGDKTITDSHRGKGVFDLVFNKLLKIKKNYPEYWQQNVQISCVFENIDEYLEQKYFFTNHLPRIKVYYTPIAQKEQSIRIKLFEDIFNRLINYTGKLINFIYYPEVKKIVQTKLKILSKKVIMPIKFSRADCNPFSSMMFVKENGNIYYCMNNQVPSFQVGTCKELDFDSIKSGLAEYFDFKNKLCSKCWAVRFCKNCYSQAFDKYRFNKDIFNKNCERMKEILLLKFEFTLKTPVLREW